MDLISIFGPVGPKSKNPHEFSSLNFMFNETILEMPYQLNFGKNRLEILSFFFFGWGLGADFHIWAHGPKIKVGY